MNRLKRSNDILLEIIQWSDVGTLKSWRLVSKAIHDLIRNYEISLCTVVARRSHSKYLVTQFLPENCTELSFHTLLRVDHRIKVARWLAEVMVDRYSYSDPSSETTYISARDDPILPHLETGCSVLWRLADIADRVEKDWKRKRRRSSANENALTAKARTFRSLLQMEAVVLAERRIYVESLSDREILGWNLWHWISRNIFAHGIPVEGGKIIGADQYEDRVCWTNWLVLKDGPGFFEKAWGSLDGNIECARYVARIWSERWPEEQQIETKAAVEIWKSLWRVRDNLPPRGLVEEVQGFSARVRKKANPQQTVPWLIGGDS